jgi:signal transduction histidine kinase
VEIHCSGIRLGDRALLLSLARDISERKENEQRLHDSYRQLQELACRRNIDLEEERKRIAHELHDELGQHLTVLRLGISTLRFSHSADYPVLDKPLEKLCGQVDTTIRVVRSVATSLRPPALEMGLRSALDWLAAQFRETTGLDCRIDGPADFCCLAEEAAITLYRIIQEALTNVARHAGATTVNISVRHAADCCRIVIQDDGAGFDVATIQTKSLGLLGMRERTRQIGGVLAIHSAPGKGTRLEVSLPHSRGNE